MNEFIAAITSFPTVVFTVALLVVVGYWLLALIGGIGSEILDSAAGKIDGAIDAMAGKVDGAVDAMAGKIDGAVDAMAGKVDGAVDAMAGKVDGAVEAMVGKVDGAVDAASGKIDGLAGKVEAASGGFSLLAALGFGKAPATVVITMLTLFAWTLSTLGTLWAMEYGVQSAPINFGIGLGAAMLAGMLSGLAARALGRAFKRHQPLRRGQLVGKLATVTTGRVDENFGQASVEEDGLSLIVDVRCPTPNSLARHTKVVLVSYDEVANTYTVEAFEQKDIQARP